MPAKKGSRPGVERGSYDKPRRRTPRRREKGPPPHTPDKRSRRLVEMLNMLNFHQSTIGKVLGCNDKTLRKHYRYELDVAYAELGAKMMNVGILRAMGAYGGPPGVPAQPDPEKVDSYLWRIIMERRFGLVAPPVKVSGALGIFDPTKLTDAELAAVEPILAKLAGVGAEGAHGASGGESEEGGEESRR
jgi:hypothetical protein